VKIKKLQQNTLSAKPTALSILKIIKLETYMSFHFDSDRMDTNIDYSDDNNHLGDGLNIGVDVISRALEDFISAIIDFKLAYYATAHYINDRVIIYHRFNEIILLLF
jgi:hypothetical protein